MSHKQYYWQVWRITAPPGNWRTTNQSLETTTLSTLASSWTTRQTSRPPSLPTAHRWAALYCSTASCSFLPAFTWVLCHCDVSVQCFIRLVLFIYPFPGSHPSTRLLHLHTFHHFSPNHSFGVTFHQTTHAHHFFYHPYTTPKGHSKERNTGTFELHIIKALQF